MSAGPLDGVRVVELASLAPAPFGCMLLADLGADVVRVERPRPGRGIQAPPGPLDRGRRSVELDLGERADSAVLRELLRKADVLIEGFRPGVAERLGLGPDDVLRENPRLVYGRMTGWGQTGPMAGEAGHDINYIALAGALEPIGAAGERPIPPLNLVGDFGGGGLLLAFGIVAALLERERSGRGQVVDAAMVDGANLLMTFLHGLKAAGWWDGSRGENLLDSGAPFYDTYACADGAFVAVGCIEPEFYAEFLRLAGLDADGLGAQYDRGTWAAQRAAFARRLATRTRDEWAAVFAGSDACVTPVLTPWEAHRHEHHRERGAFVTVDDVRQPAPAPRFSRSQLGVPRSPQRGVDVDAILRGWA